MKWEEKTILYCGFLSKEGIQSTTIRSYVSAIKHKLILDGYKWDSDLVLFSALTRATKLTKDRVRTRLPIGAKFLDVILFEIQCSFRENKYNQQLYKTLYLTAYYGLMRVGELTSSPHVLKAVDVNDARNKKGFKLILHTSKTHGRHNYPQKIKICPADKNHNCFCPVEELTKFLQLRGRTALTKEESFFIFKDRRPVRPVDFRNSLKRMIHNLGLDSSLYDTHSFRIGRATDLFKRGVQVDVIKEAGRWKSNAVYKYLR